MFGIALFNGLQVDDSPPGTVGRYVTLQPGTWFFARVLLYSYRSFPLLWTPPESREHYHDKSNLSYKDWVLKLEKMNLEEGAWAVFARQLSRFRNEIDLSHQFVTDLCGAIIELATRDAEIERNVYRSIPLQLRACRDKDEDTAPRNSEDERVFMGKVRSAIRYQPRVRRIEECVYRALVVVDVSMAHSIARNAPDYCPVHKIVAEGIF